MTKQTTYDARLLPLRSCGECRHFSARGMAGGGYCLQNDHGAAVMPLRRCWRFVWLFVGAEASIGTDALVTIGAKSHFETNQPTKVTS